MTLSHRYQNFGGSEAPHAAMTATNVEKIEEEKLQSFENGYQSGWDDAVAAQSTTRNNVTAEFARNLQEASFAYHEARTALVRDLRQLVEPLLEQLLPTISRETLALHVAEQIEDAAKSALETPIEICVAPERIQTMQSLFDDVLTEPFVLVPEDTLSEDQVFFRLGNTEREIDFQPWLQQVRDALTAYFDSL